MALKQTVNFRGINIPDAYIKIGVLMIHSSNDHIEFSTQYMASGSDTPFNSKTVTCNYSLLGENPIKQAYEYLKTLSEFEDATDC
jgi:hypothetical protein